MEVLEVLEVLEEGMLEEGMLGVRRRVGWEGERMGNRALWGTSSSGVGVQETAEC